MSKVKSGDLLCCEVCGLAVVVDEECGCAVADIICCEEPMVNKGPAVPKKKAIAAAAPKKKTTVTKVKAAAKKSVAKKKAAPKPALKKKTAKKPAKK